MPFSTLAGHRRLITLLSRAAARETLPPSLLFAGPAGVGKRSTALALAQAVNCTNPRASEDLERDACGACPACRRIERGVHPDVILIEPGDTGSIKIEQIRDVIDRAGYRPFEGRRRLVIIDEADALGEAAQNALLKTLEEPPSASLFVLVSSMPDALLPTVRSRCPRLRFGELSAGEVASVLTRDHGYSDADARAAAVEADGSISRALQSASADLTSARESATRVLEQTARVTDPGRRIELARTLTPAKGTPALERAQLAASLRALASLLRDLGVLGVRGESGTLANADLAPRLRALARSYTSERSMAAYTVVDRALGALERNASPKIVADWLVVNL